MKLVLAPFVALLGLLGSYSAHADSGPSGEAMDEASEKALHETKAMLVNPKAREAAIRKDANARHADDDVRKVTGGSEEAADAIYALSAEVMETITREAKGDPDKMKEMLIRALRDPEGFAAKFTPAQKARLKAISERVPDPDPKKAKP